LAKLHELSSTCDERLADFDTTGAGRALADFIDDLSNWYVRRSRQRFWNADMDALATLYECLDVLTRLLAPFVPFITEQVWREVVAPGMDSAAVSVHLTSWPEPDKALLNPELVRQVRTARALTEAGRAARKASGVRVRQPLGRALVNATLSRELLDEIADELNVRTIEPLGAAGELVDVTVKANFRALGRRFGKQTQTVANAITAADPATLVGQLRAEQLAEVIVDGESVPIGPDEVIISETPRTGWAVETQQDLTIALDTEITPELRLAGLAREVIRLVQDSRKKTGLQVADRIDLRYRAGDEVARAIADHRAEIATAVLALSVEPGEESGWAHQDDPELGVDIWLAKKP
jgi:isoleucyl-tRNA synthetase